MLNTIGAVKMENTYSREGYLYEDFRFFHLKDSLGQEYSFHYHDFDKIVIFLSGNVDYHIEGASYKLKPWDIILVNRNLIHKAAIDTSVPYERIIIYLNTDFIKENSTENTDLMSCFRIVKERENFLLRPTGEETEALSALLDELEEEIGSKKFGSDVMAKSAYIRLLCRLCRMAVRQDSDRAVTKKSDPKLSEILLYINENLGGNLSVDGLAARCFLSKYHFMRRFKEMTGYTVHSYIQHKRLFLAAELIRGGRAASEAALLSGFGDYSTFLRAFKKMYGVTPGKFI